MIVLNRSKVIVSTHSRPKAAGTKRRRPHRERLVSTHSRPKAAGALKNTINATPK